MQKSSKTLSEAEIDEKLNRVITLFNYLADKDLFQQVRITSIAVGTSPSDLLRKQLI